MLKPRSNPPSHDELIAYVRHWLDRLADGSLDEACELIDEPNGYGIHWTPQEIRRVLEETFSPDSRFRAEHPDGPVFSRPDEALGDGRASVIEFDNGAGYSVWHDVPLNGAYSDLTAQVQFLWRGDDLAFILDDLHVM